MLNLYDDIPDQYSMQKMIYDDSKTLQDLIDKMTITEKPKNDAKPYDYNNKTMPPMVKDEKNGDCQTSDTLPETSETIKGGSMGLKIENKKSLKNEALNCTTPPWGLVRCKSVVLLAPGRSRSRVAVGNRRHVGDRPESKGFSYVLVGPRGEGSSPPYMLKVGAPLT